MRVFRGLAPDERRQHMFSFFSTIAWSGDPHAVSMQVVHFSSPY